MTKDGEFVTKEKIAVLADLETIRVHRFKVYQARKATNHPNTTSADLDDVPVEKGATLIVNEISARDIDNAPTRIEIGIVVNGTFFVHVVEAAPAATVTTRFAGQLTLKDGDFIRARVVGATALDDIEMVVNGYKIRE